MARRDLGFYINVIHSAEKKLVKLESYLEEIEQELKPKDTE